MHVSTDSLTASDATSNSAQAERKLSSKTSKISSVQWLQYNSDTVSSSVLYKATQGSLQKQVSNKESKGMQLMWRKFTDRCPSAFNWQHSSRGRPPISLTSYEGLCNYNTNIIILRAILLRDRIWSVSILKLKRWQNVGVPASHPAPRSYDRSRCKRYEARRRDTIWC